MSYSPSESSGDEGCDSMSTVSSTISLADMEECANRVILVTGGAGFIGSATAAELLRRGDTVIIIDELNDYYDVNLKRGNLDRLASRYPDRVHVYIGDICDQELLENIFSCHSVDSIIHLAARAGVRPSINDPFIYVHSNVKGQVTLLEAARKFGINHFVYASSSSVYGGSQQELFSEKDIVDSPVSQYAATKKSCELMASTYNSLYGINTTGLRFFTVYGPNGRPDMAPFKFIDRVYRGVAMDQYGDGTSERDYTFIDDIVQGVVLAVDKPLGNQVFNLGKGGCTSLKYFINLVAKYVGKKPIINYLPDQPGDVPRTRADISHAQNLLGYNPTTSFEDGLKKTVDWYVNEYSARNKASETAKVTGAPQLVQKNALDGLAVATRVHSIKADNLMVTLEKVKSFFNQATAFATRTSIAVSCSLDDSANHLLKAVQELAAQYDDKVVVLPVLNWSGFTPALNALLSDAAQANCRAIMFASLEMKVDEAAAYQLLSDLEKDTLVVGARLPGHQFSTDKSVMLNGVTTPWNTLAVWSVDKLVKTGFLAVADGLTPESKTNAGVEEVSVIALHQSFAPLNSKAKLIQVAGIQWDTEWASEERKQYHTRKMESKASRAQAQQKVLGLASGTVCHI